MVMVIIFSTLVVKIRTCGHKICTFLAHFTVYGMNFASCVLVFSRILLPTHKKFCICGGLGPLASPSHPQHHVFLASPRAVQQSHAHSVCKWPVWLYLLFSLRSTPWAVGCTPHLCKAATVGCQYGVAVHKHYNCTRVQLCLKRKDRESTAAAKSGGSIFKEQADRSCLQTSRQHVLRYACVLCDPKVHQC